MLLLMTEVPKGCNGLMIFMPWWAESYRHTVVIMCVCEWVSESFREIAVRVSPRSLKIKNWNMQCKVMQYYVEIELVNFGLEALMLSYGMIYSPWKLLLAIQSPAKKKSLTTGCLLTWQFNLYRKSDSDQSNPENENAKATQPKLIEDMA